MVDGRVIAVAGAKGGVGKTTTCINLGTEFAAAGYATVVVELDLAMANLVDFLDLELDPAQDTTFHDVLSGDAAIGEAVYESIHGLAVVPSGTSLEGYAETDMDRLPVVTALLRREYDFVLFDTPAGVSEETVEPIRMADEVVLVSTPRVSSVRNADNTLELAGRMGADTLGLVLTKSGTGASPGAETIAAFLGVDLLGHVPEEDSIPYSQDRGLPVVVNAPKSDAAAAYRDIARELAPGEFLFPPPTSTHEERNGTLTERIGRPMERRRPETPGVDSDPQRGPGVHADAESANQTTGLRRHSPDEKAGARYAGATDGGPQRERRPGKQEATQVSETVEGDEPGTEAEGEPDNEVQGSLRKRVLSYLST